MHCLIGSLVGFDEERPFVPHEMVSRSVLGSFWISDLGPTQEAQPLPEAPKARQLPQRRFAHVLNLPSAGDASLGHSKQRHRRDQDLQSSV